MKYTFTWLLLAIAVALGLGSFNWLSCYRLMKRGTRAQGTVTELLPNVHATVRYKYNAAGGRTFGGQMQSWLPNKPLEQLQIGEAVVIYYDPDHPEKSVLGDPGRILQNETISIILAAIGAPSFILIVVAWKNRKKMQHKKVPHGATS